MHQPGRAAHNQPTTLEAHIEEHRMTARMLGTWSRPWCPYCRAPAGRDCPDKARAKKAQRALEKRGWKRDVDPEVGRRR